MQLDFWLAQLFSGVANGSLYGLMAMSIVILYRANHIMNFAQTEMATFFVIIMFFLLKKMSFYWALAAITFLSFAGGALLHLGVMRVITERRRALRANEVVVTIGFFSIFNSVSAYIFGDDPEAFPTPFGNGAMSLAGVEMSTHSLATLVFCAVAVLIIYLFFRFTRLGLAMEAVAENMVAARLRGVRSSNVLAIAWGLTTMISVYGGILIAPSLFLTPMMLLNVLSYCLIAVVIGGLESPGGALIGGVMIGVVENLAANVDFIGSELKFVAIFVFLILILIVKPRGLWGRNERRRV